MRFIINYIRECFCNHDFKYDEEYCEELKYFQTIKTSGTKVSKTCKKCGYHKSYWKF